MNQVVLFSSVRPWIVDHFQAKWNPVLQFVLNPEEEANTERRPCEKRCISRNIFERTLDAFSKTCRDISTYDPLNFGGGRYSNSIVAYQIDVRLR